MAGTLSSHGFSGSGQFYELDSTVIVFNNATLFNISIDHCETSQTRLDGRDLNPSP